MAQETPSDVHILWWAVLEQVHEPQFENPCPNVYTLNGGINGIKIYEKKLFFKK